MNDNEQTLPSLGLLALEMGFAAPAQVNAAVVQHQANPGSLLGEVLVERRVLTPSQLRELLARQREMIEKALDKPEGLFSF